jgi:hypothetical protein
MFQVLLALSGTGCVVFFFFITANIINQTWHKEYQNKIQQRRQKTKQPLHNPQTEKNAAAK